MSTGGELGGKFVIARLVDGSVRIQRLYRHLSSLCGAAQPRRPASRADWPSEEEAVRAMVLVDTGQIQGSRRRKRSLNYLDFMHSTTTESLRLEKPAFFESNIAKLSQAARLDGTCNPSEYGGGSYHSARANKISVAKTWTTGEGELSEAFKALDRLVQQESYVPRDMLYRVLKDCIVNKDLDSGRRVHGLAVRSGYEFDRFLANHIIRMYVCCGKLAEATAVFSKLSAPDTFVWSSIISAYVEKGEPEQAIQLYRKMRQSTLRPNDYVYVAVLKACGCAQDLASGREVHAAVMAAQLESNIFVANTLLDMYAKCGCLEDARAVFDRLPFKTIVTWTAMIAAYAQQGLGQEALTVYGKMQQDGRTIANRVTFLCLLKACASIGALKEGKRLHGHVRERGLETDVVVGSTLVDMYAKCGSLVDARTVFDQLVSKNAVTWNAMLAGYIQHGHVEEVLNLFESMQQQGIKPDRVSFICGLKACARLGAIQKGKQFHYNIQSSGLETDLVLANAVIDMYAKCGSLKDARSLFDRLPSKDVVTWGTLIAGYAQHGLSEEALNLYGSMQQQGLTPDKGLLVCCLKACATLGNIQLGNQVHQQIRESGLESDLAVGNTLVDMYAKCGSLEDACRVYEMMPSKDVITWTAMICGYAQHGLGQEALDLYSSMLQEGKCLGDEVTFVSIIRACGSVGALQMGKRIHAEIVERKSEGNMVIGNALVDMYVRCGSMEDAQRVFDGLYTKDVVTWTALINGHSRYNDHQAAMQSFKSMLQQGVEPDGATFVCLLVACSHLGLVTEGQHYFRMMVDKYSIAPNADHYNCMVDLLGRSGRLDEAADMLQTMGLEHDVVGLRSLLSACKTHGDVERGRRCFDRLIQLQPQDAAAYVLMSNICTNAGRLEEAAKIENMRQCAGAAKKPAKTWIQVNGRVLELMVGEERDDIRSKLRSMNLRLKEQGHVPHTELVLKPLSEQGKEDSLCGHAEKLALAYGLLNTPDGTTLLITKTLRMCNDCHSGTKILSRIEKREIIVRDAHRVHRFKDGFCSCGDFH